MRTLEERLLSGRRIAEYGCWEWTRHSDRYGIISISKKLKKVHRVSWELFVGPIHDGMYVCHKCDNGICFNPDHLFLGTQKDNMSDCARKGRIVLARRCPNEKLARGERNGMVKYPRLLAAERNGRSKLTNLQRFEISKRSDSGESRVTLAKEFGVDVSQIHRAKRWVKNNATADAILLAEYGRRTFK